VAIFFLVFHLLLALSAAIWFTLFSTMSPTASLSSDAEENELVLPPSGGGEVDDRTFDTFLITASSNRDQQSSRQKENQNTTRHDEQVWWQLWNLSCAVEIQ